MATATNLDKLVVQLSADIRGYERAMRQAMGVTNRQARAIEQRQQQMVRVLDRTGARAARSFIAPLTGISAALSTRAVARYADAWTVAGNQIRAASEISGMQARSLEEVRQIADDTRSGMAETAQLYARLMRSAGGVARSEMEIARATEIVNKAFAAGGVATSERIAGILQLGQALGSGFLQGDELRSIRENAPLLAQAIADYFGVTIAGLKDLGAEGQLTSERVFRAILAAQGQIDRAFGATASTIQDAITRVENAFTQYIGQTDESLSASQRLVAGLNALADNFDSIADTVVRVAAIIAGGLVGRSIAGMVKNFGLAASAVSAFVAAARAATTMTGIATAIGGLSVAAGPIGAVLGVTAVGAMILFSRATDDAGSASDRFRDRMRRAAEEALAAANATEEAYDRMRNAASRQAGEVLPELEAEAEEGARAIGLITSELDAALSTMIAMAGQGIVSAEQARELEELRNALRRGTLNADLLDSSLSALGQSGNLGGLIENVRALGAELFNALRAAIGLDQQLSQVRQVAGIDLTDDQISQMRDQIGRFWGGVRGRRASAAFLAEQQRLNSLSRDQLRLEQEIARVRRDSTEAGVQLTEAQIRTLAGQRIAAEEGRRGGGGREDRFGDSIRRETAALLAEADALNSVTEVTGRYSIAVERARREAELMEMAQQRGLTLTPALRESIAALADEWARAAEANADANDRIEQLESISGRVRDALSGAFDGVFDDPKRALEDLGKQLLMIALKMQLVRMFPGVFGQEGIVPLQLAGGGPVRGPGTSTSDSIPARLSNGEYVVNAKATAQHRDLLDAINSGKVIARAGGGPVGYSAPSIPRAMPRVGGESAAPVINIHNEGAPVAVTRTETSRGPDGRQMFDLWLNESVARGRADKAMQGRFGAKPAKVKI